MFRTALEKIHPAVFLKAAQTELSKVSEQQQRFVDICALSAEAALQRLEVTESGLSEEQADSARDIHGSNNLGAKKRVGLLVELAERCRNPLVIQLLVICLVALVMGDLRSAVVIGGMIVLSVVLAYVQEHRSSKAVERLQAMVSANCLVVREGKETTLPIAQVVPGDIVVLQAGSLIPADLRLISAKDFFVSQSSLTGESMPVEKHADPASATGRGIIELPNACFQGSNVLSGTARGVVVNTGRMTQFGSISEKLAGHRVQTSFDKGHRRLHLADDPLHGGDGCRGVPHRGFAFP